MREKFDTLCLDMAEEFSGTPAEYIPFPDITVRDSWEGLTPELKKLIISDGEAALNRPYPIISASDYMSFKQRGNRIDFETVYFARRHMLNSLVLAECVENHGRFLSKIIDGIWHLVEESSWVLPAHNSYERDAEQLILPDSTRPIIELFSCETGAQLSMVLALLRPVLNGVSPVISSRIEHELKTRIIIPYLTGHFWWMGNHDEPMCNWTPWCTQNILLTVFTNPALTDATEKLTVIRKASYSLDCFLKEYGEDGCCDEGAQYYRHAGLCLYGCLDILNVITGRHFDALYGLDKIKNIAAYISRVHIDGPWYFNFADCSAKAGRTGVREFFFGKATVQKFLMDFAAADFRASYNEGSIFKDESQQLNLYYRTQTVFAANEVLKYADTVNEISTPPDTFYESTGLWICRSNNFAVAVKAGDNDDSHNHNDVGSLTVFKNGEPILADIGVGTYSAKTFSSERYELPTMQSCYHNTPTICGLDQLSGASYCADKLELLGTAFEEPKSPKKQEAGPTGSGFIKSIAMNLEGAYPATLGEGFYRRKVAIEGTESNTSNDRIILEDSFSYNDVVLNFITYEEPQICGNIISIGQASMSISGEIAGIHKETFPITDARLKTAWNHDLYRLRIKVCRSVKIVIE